MNNIRQQIRRQLGDKTTNLITNQIMHQTSNNVILQAEGEVFQQVSGQLYQSFEPNVKMTMLNHNYSLFLQKLIDYGD